VYLHIYICLYICTQTHTHTLSHTYIRVPGTANRPLYECTARGEATLDPAPPCTMYASVSTRACTRTHIHAHTHARTHARTPTYTHTYRHTYTHTHTGRAPKHARTHACTLTRTHACTGSFGPYAYLRPWSARGMGAARVGGGVRVLGRSKRLERFARGNLQ